MKNPHKGKSGFHQGVPAFLRRMVMFLSLLILSDSLKSYAINPSSDPILLVLAVDASKSSVKSPKPTIQDLRNVAALIYDRNVGGTIAFAVIGNPPNQHRHFYRCHFDKVPMAPKDAPLIDRSRIGQTAKKIDLKNRERFEKWCLQYKQIVLEYKPNGPELSKVAEVFEQANLLLREPAYINHTKLLVFSSDLQNEPLKSNQLVPWKINLDKITKLSIIATGTSIPNPLSKFSAYLPLADITGLLPNIEQFFTQKDS